MAQLFLLRGRTNFILEEYAAAQEDVCEGLTRDLMNGALQAELQAIQVGTARPNPARPANCI